MTPKTSWAPHLESHRNDAPTTSSVSLRSSHEDAVLLKPGDRVDRFVIQRMLGQGGMGVVFEAVETAPTQRRVALKMLNGNAYSEEVVRRFESERDVLAHLQHPNIARFLDSGKTSQGYPYIAMDLIQGYPITEFCDKRRLNVEDRIRLFEPICDAVHYAHSLGFIHRDLKPANLLVENGLRPPTPKVIDFGLAKAILPTVLHGGNTKTNHGHRLGTPAYMSPEQASGSPMDVSTASDVYTLGTVLYEVLTGSLPLSWSRDGSDDFERVLREVTPVRPSALLHASGQDEADRERLAKVAESRGCSIPRLRATLRGDLDWILLRCLRKNPAERYATPKELWEDLRRYLDHEPVRAGPPSVAYRIHKFSQRHRKSIVASALGAAVTPIWLVAFTGPIVSAAAFSLLVGVGVAVALAVVELTRITWSPTLAMVQLALPLGLVLLAGIDPVRLPDNAPTERSVLSASILPAVGGTPDSSPQGVSKVQLLATIEYPKTVRVGESFVVKANFDLQAGELGGPYSEALLESNVIDVQMHFAGAAISPQSSVSLTPTRSEIGWSVAAGDTGVHTAFLSPSVAADRWPSGSRLGGVPILLTRPEDLTFNVRVRPKELEWARFAILLIGVPLVVGQIVTMVYGLVRWIKQGREDRAQRDKGRQLIRP